MTCPSCLGTGHRWNSELMSKRTSVEQTNFEPSIQPSISHPDRSSAYPSVHPLTHHPSLYPSAVSWSHPGIHLANLSNDSLICVYILLCICHRCIYVLCCLFSANHRCFRGGDGQNAGRKIRRWNYGICHQYAQHKYAAIFRSFPQVQLTLYPIEIRQSHVSIS